MKNTNSAEYYNGTVIANYGQQAEIEADDGAIHHCFSRQNIENVVAGDKVIWQPTTAESGIIVRVEPRTTELKRSDNRRNKIIAANIDMMAIVVAPEPMYSKLLMDRYLVAAECLNITPFILFNKIDLFNEAKQQELLDQLANYQKIGYEILTSSAIGSIGIAELQKRIENYTSIFVGQSGVGKSSLIARLLPQQTIAVGRISHSTKLGRHTTTAARLYHLENLVGNIIDSPGVRGFGLWHVSPEELFDGFKEFRQYKSQCKFRNCQHKHDPGCALQQAVKNGEISAERLESFHKIIAEI